MKHHPYDRILAVVFLSAVSSCQSGESSDSRAVHTLLDQPQKSAHQSSQGSPTSKTAESGKADSLTNDGPAIATVNGHPIFSGRFDRLLEESYGLSVLEQLVGLELARQRAQQQGVQISDADVTAEYNRSVIEMARAVSTAASEAELRRTGEQLLKDFLQDKNISRQEYMMSMERNATLRRLTAEDVRVSDKDVQREFEIQYGPRAIVRHIVLADLSAVTEIRNRLSQGEEFTALARQHSLNRLSGLDGGLLPPISEKDDQVPLMMRKTVFSLQPGQLSDAVRIDGQFHLFQMERLEPSRESVMTPEIADTLRRQLRDTQTRQLMQQMEERLFREAEIKIERPVLKQQFTEKYTNGNKKQ